MIFARGAGLVVHGAGQGQHRIVHPGQFPGRHGVEFFALLQVVQPGAGDQFRRADRGRLAGERRLHRRIVDAQLHGGVFEEILDLQDLKSR